MSRQDKTKAAHIIMRLRCMVETKSPRYGKPPSEQTIETFTNFLSMVDIPLNLTKLAVSRRRVILFFKKNMAEMGIKGDNFGYIECEGTSFTGYYNGKEFTFTNAVAFAKYMEQEYRAYISAELEARRERLLNDNCEEEISENKETTSEPLQV